MRHSAAEQPTRARVQAEEPGRAARRPDPGERPEDCRCLCGSLVARITAEGVELKCRRCKRTLLVSFPAARLGSASGALSVSEAG